MQHRLSGKHGGECIFEIVSGGRWSLHAEVHVAVVDSAAIDDSTCDVEDRRLGRDGHLGQLDERMLRIAQDTRRIPIRFNVVANGL